MGRGSFLLFSEILAIVALAHHTELVHLLVTHEWHKAFLAGRAKHGPTLEEELSHAARGSFLAVLPFFRCEFNPLHFNNSIDIIKSLVTFNNITQRYTQLIPCTNKTKLSAIIAVIMCIWDLLLSNCMFVMKVFLSASCCFIEDSSLACWA